jgi:hypothetical protein
VIEGCVFFANPITEIHIDNNKTIIFDSEIELNDIIIGKYSNRNHRDCGTFKWQEGDGI